MSSFVWAALAGDLVAFGLLLRPFRRRLGVALLAVASLLNWAAVAFAWTVLGQPPFANLHHVLTVLGACFGPVYFALARPRGLGWLAPYFAAGAALPLGASFLLEHDDLWRMAPALQSPWFIPHVLSYMVSYAMATLAFLVGVAALYRRRAGHGEDADRLDLAGYRLLAFAFPLMTFGMVSGAVWAAQAWGPYWSWDPKETWSLITWTLYLIYFHCRRAPALARYVVPAQILAFLALVTTFVLVNLLPKLASALHSYA